MKPRKSWTAECQECGEEFQTKIKTKMFCSGNCQAKAFSKQEANPVGRPTKYKKEYCERLLKHMTEGLSFESFGGEVGVCIDTVHEWAKVHPEFSEAKRAGSAGSRMFWEKMGRSGACGKLPGFQGGTWVFNMKNRFRWADRSEVVTKDETLTDVEDMQDDEIESRLQHALKVIAKYESGTSTSESSDPGSTKKKAKKKTRTKG